MHCEHMNVVIIEGSPSSFKANVFKEMDYNFIALRDELAKFKHLEIQNPDHSFDKLGEPSFTLQITCAWPRPFRHRMVKDEVLRTETQNCRHVTTSEGIEKFLDHTHVLLLAHVSFKPVFVTSMLLPPGGGTSTVNPIHLRSETRSFVKRE